MITETIYKFSDKDIKLLKEILHNPCHSQSLTDINYPEDYRKYRIAVAEAIQEGMGFIVNTIEKLTCYDEIINTQQKERMLLFKSLPKQVQELIEK